MLVLGRVNFITPVKPIDFRLFIGVTSNSIYNWIVGARLVYHFRSCEERSSGSSSTVRLSPEDALFQDAAFFRSDICFPKAKVAAVEALLNWW